MAAGASAFRAASEAVYVHGQVADEWPAGRALTASALARRMSR
jgi:NAD(P)H-hydrate repair Nnr-like enzyme with NAD(P)H-hydrate dehydratase domain